MDDNASTLAQDELFVGLTRPAMIMGVPYMAAVMEMMITFTLFIGSGYLRALLVLPLAHGVLYAITATDPGRLHSLFMGAQTLLVSRNTRFWKAVSVAPMRTHSPKSDRDGFLGI